MQTTGHRGAKIYLPSALFFSTTELLSVPTGVQFVECICLHLSALGRLFLTCMSVAGVMETSHSIGRDVASEVAPEGFYSLRHGTTRMIPRNSCS